ncbi:conserved membrane protein of unknown function [Candidatus Filomicrobium marinum]|uniref:Zinc/iron permease n=2 Tax=Candidatus Filomicrobium marinum TaxID=1608628 RepID=A0A0D6JC85_9HYPH|nr:conserved membrane protein of unknown function [Candidatus Filomicrobium marinum]CPR16110.1 conserved membrane protein of unknown function [Candidatus Filomicrobium marinum]
MRNGQAIMTDLSQVLLFAMLPVMGVLIGTTLAETFRAPGWVIGATLHGAAGVAIALVSVDLMPRIVDQIAMTTLISAFLAGAVVSVIIERTLRIFRSTERQPKNLQAWMVYTAIAADLASDGALTGAGSAIGHNLGLLVAASQAIANIPGGFAAASNLRNRNVLRHHRWIAAVAMTIPAMASAALAYWLLADADQALRSTTLAFISGVLLLATIEDVVPQGDAPKPARWLSTASFAFGFSGLALLSAYV